MSSRSIALLSATAIGLFTGGAVVASAVMTIAGLTVGLIAALIISIKTDDPTRTMSEILFEEPQPVETVEVLVEERVAA